MPILPGPLRRLPAHLAAAGRAGTEAGHDRPAAGHSTPGGGPGTWPAADEGRPFQAVYDASKSFVQSFAEALRNDLKDTGVTVTSLMPGPTDTEFFDRAEMADTRVGSGRKDDPPTVAEQGFAAMMRGDQTVTVGPLLNKVQTAAGKTVPDRLKAAQHRRMAGPGSGS
ncbi:SDR family NAD(P)-dependent oxidoreductase [Micromonospora echinofusca]|uniref:SDR family NAD(P)-dependent oxidoreductase n=1 Tax=Micromonospora echinofusca TaxID=47858 RepID=UPI0034403C2B